MKFTMISVGEFPTLKIDSIGYGNDRDAIRGPGGIRDDYVIHYTLSGKGTYNGYEITRGQGFIMKPGFYSEYYSDDKEFWECIWITTKDKSIEKFFDYYNIDWETGIFSFSFCDELSFFKEMLMNYGKLMVNRAEILELYMAIIKNHLSEFYPYTYASSSKMYVDYAIEYISSNYQRKINVSDITKFLGVSQPYLFKVFKAYKGKSPKEYIIEYKITKAKQLILETNMSITDVSKNVGYDDSLAFSKIFAHYEGVSPRSYRVQKKETNSNI